MDWNLKQFFYLGGGMGARGSWLWTGAICRVKRVSVLLLVWTLINLSKLCNSRSALWSLISQMRIKRGPNVPGSPFLGKIVVDYLRESLKHDRRRFPLMQSMVLHFGLATVWYWPFEMTNITFDFEGGGSKSRFNRAVVENLRLIRRVTLLRILCINLMIIG